MGGSDGFPYARLVMTQLKSINHNIPICNESIDPENACDGGKWK
jgi:hypothetical protein